MRLFISKTYPIKGAPIYRAYHIGEIITRMGHNTSVLDLVETLETSITPKPVITFDDASRLDFWKAL